MLGIGLPELIILLVIIGVPIAIIILVRLNRKNSQHGVSAVGSANQKYVGIGGWLILPAIGLVLGLIVGVLGLLACFGMYSDIAKAGYGGIYMLEILVIIGLIGFTLYAAILFFKKKNNAPNAIITLLILSLVSSVVLLIIELGAGAEPFAIETGKQLVREIISAAIWIPYFRTSERVKATFVN
jgi:hypothetical protein